MSTAAGLDGVQALSDAAAAVGLSVAVGAGDGALDLILRNPAGGLVSVEVKRLRLASVDGLQRRLAAGASGCRTRPSALSSLTG